MAKLKKTLSVADKFYIEQHVGKKSIEDMASDLGTLVPVVEAYVTTLPPPKKKRGGKFQVKSETVAMTSAQSTDDNEAPKVDKKSAFLKSMDGCVAKVFQED